MPSHNLLFFNIYTYNVISVLFCKNVAVFVVQIADCTVGIRTYAVTHMCGYEF